MLYKESGGNYELVQISGDTLLDRLPTICLYIPSTTTTQSGRILVPLIDFRDNRSIIRVNMLLIFRPHN